MNPDLKVAIGDDGNEDSAGYENSDGVANSDWEENSDGNEDSGSSKEWITLVASKTKTAQNTSEVVKPTTG
jgi:hypothetical protein